MNPIIRVLIVDDNIHIRKTIKDDLHKFNCHCIEAETGDEAWEKLIENKFDVIFLDNKLPGLDGLDIIRKAKDLQMPLGKVILLTGLDEINESIAKELGVFLLLTKDKMDLEIIRESFINAIKS